MTPYPLSPEEKSLSLKTRLFSGEKIPLDELKEFILLSYSTLEKQKKAAEKPTDVNFF